MDTRTEQYIRNYLRDYKPYKNGQWCYEDGCILIGAIDLYHATGDTFYRDYVLEFLSGRIMPDGSIPCYETAQYNIDSINSGKALFFALDETGEQRYRNAIEYHMQRLNEHPRCESGNFWHKTLYPDQVWLDGMYMAQPFYAEYAARFGTKEQVQDIHHQFEFVRSHLYAPEKALYYHGCDTSGRQPWANPVTGCSANFWLRSMGWYVMALVDCIDKLGGSKPLTMLLREAADGLLQYQDPDSGLWYQVIDHPEESANYLETSGSAMAAYTLMKGSRLGLLDGADAGKKALNHLISDKLITGPDGKVLLDDICAVAGLGPGEKRDGSVAYYLSEPIKADDAKGVGPFMMAVAEGETC